MDKIIEAVLKLLPFGAWLEQLGLGKELSAGLAVLITAVLLYYLSLKVKQLQAYLQNKKTAKDLSPYFEYQKVKQATDLYIHTQGQNLPPTHEEEMAQSAMFIVKKRLIPWFIRNAFDEKKESDKFYLILADSGMGKTTFLINLYIRYMSRWGKKHQIKLLPFGDDRIIKHLEELAKKQDDAKNTILLLDAFDEYKGLLPPETPDGLSDDERFRKRLDEIVELTRDFREVVITSRTQYFPGQEDKPYELKIPRFDDKGFHTLAKMYLSPFDNDEIKRYLNKKYGVLQFWNRRKKRIAESIVKASPKLMVRPMLLAYIDYLVEDKRQFKTTYQIYETLIEKWIEREANKRKHESTTREKFKRDLYAFSRKIALVVYDKHRQHSTLSVDKEAARQLCEAENLDLRDYEITGQSLLTRDANHHWKFAHKSILEFFLAKEAAGKPGFLAELLQSNFAGMDMAKTFCDEVGVPDMVFVKGGTFTMGCTAEQGGDCQNNEKPARQVSLSDYYIGRTQVTVAQFAAFIEDSGYRTEAEQGGGSYIWSGSEWKLTKGVDWRCDEKGKSRAKEAYDHPVIHVSWNDAVAYCEWLSRKSGGRFQLPTEAEWEYAARGGSLSKGFKYAGSDNLGLVAWHSGNSGSKMYPVARKISNELGLFDMSGNVWEWCADDWHDSYEKAPTDGSAWVDSPQRGSFRVLRGGSWNGNAEFCRVSGRNFSYPDYRYFSSGFRVVLVP